MNVSQSFVLEFPDTSLYVQKLFGHTILILKKSSRKCTYDNPYTASKTGRIICIYPETNLRTYPGVLRGTPEWDLLW